MYKKTYICSNKYKVLSNLIFIFACAKKRNRL